MSDIPIRLVLADDHAVVREGLRHVLAPPAFVVVQEAENTAVALAAVEAHRPDVLVLDITMPGGSGLGIVEQVRAISPATGILMLSVHDAPEYVLESVRLGAHGYVRKDSSPADLRAAVRAVHEGNAYFSSAVAGHLTTALRHRGAPASEPNAAPLSVLSAREREVFTMVASGQANKEIALALGISPRTVEAHRESLMRKLGVRTVAALTRLALESGVAAERPGPR